VKRGRGAQIAALALCLFGGACSALLGLNGYRNAALELCLCPGFEKVTDCTTYGPKQLANASSEEQEKWFEEYTARKCGALCDRADECYNDLPGCAGRKPGCECCAWDDAVLACSSGACKECRTCFELVTGANAGNLPCVSSKALFDDVDECACGVCLTSCTGFCSGGEALSGDLGMLDDCSSCLMTECGAALEACHADKAGS
jgi:hypothetical protein